MSDTIHRVNHEIRQRRLQVLRVTELTPRMRRITLGGAELQGFTSMGSDDHIKLLFAETPEQQQAIEARNLGKDGGARPTMREYTPRRIDLVAHELDIDFVLHGDGPASTWAAQAAPGQTLDIAGPRASLVVPDIFDAYLLIGDETAIPAIGRRLEEFAGGPPGAGSDPDRRRARAPAAAKQGAGGSDLGTSPRGRLVGAGA